MIGWQKLVIRREKPAPNRMRGESCPWAKLREIQREAIPLLLKRGYTQREIARRMGVSQPTIWRWNRAAQEAV